MKVIPHIEVLIEVPRFDGFSTPVLQSALDAITEFLGVSWLAVNWCRQGGKIGRLPSLDCYGFDRYNVVVIALDYSHPDAFGLLRMAQVQYPNVKFLVLHHRACGEWLVTQPFTPSGALA